MDGWRLTDKRTDEQMDRQRETPFEWHILPPNFFRRFVWYETFDFFSKYCQFFRFSRKKIDHKSSVPLVILSSNISKQKCFWGIKKKTGDIDSGNRREVCWKTPRLISWTSKFPRLVCIIIRSDLSTTPPWDRITNFQYSNWVTLQCPAYVQLSTFNCLVNQWL